MGWRKLSRFALSDLTSVYRQSLDCDFARQPCRTNTTEIIFLYYINDCINDYINDSMYKSLSASVVVTAAISAVLVGAQNDTSDLATNSSGYPDVGIDLGRLALMCPPP